MEGNVDNGKKYAGYTVAERVWLSDSNSGHAVIFNDEGVAVEVRCYPGVKGFRAGPARLGIGWWNRGRTTWRHPDPITVTAKCAIAAAWRQIDKRKIENA